MRGVAAGLLMISAAAGWAGAEVLVKEGESVAFLGDSITQQGASSQVGYVRLVANGLEQAGVKIAVIPAGISGHKSNQMLARLEKDVLSKKPAWMTLSCGVNDVWHGERGVPLEQYKSNITAIVDQCQAAGVKVMILTATMIGEDQANPNNQKLIEYNDFLRSLAKERGLAMADLNEAMQAAIKNRPEGTKGNYLTTDGVHMAPRGNAMMAKGVLAAFGVDEATVNAAAEKWQDIPNAVTLQHKLSMSTREYERLAAIAAEKNMSVQQFIDAELTPHTKKLLEQATPAPADSPAGEAK